MENKKKLISLAKQLSRDYLSLGNKVHLTFEDELFRKANEIMMMINIAQNSLSEEDIDHIKRGVFMFNLSKLVGIRVMNEKRISLKYLYEFILYGKNVKTPAMNTVRAVYQDLDKQKVMYPFHIKTIENIIESNEEIKEELLSSFDRIYDYYNETFDEWMNNKEEYWKKLS